MLNILLSWSCVLLFVVTPFAVGWICEQKSQPSERGPVARLFHRY